MAGETEKWNRSLWVIPHYFLILRTLQGSPLIDQCTCSGYGSGYPKNLVQVKNKRHESVENASNIVKIYQITNRRHRSPVPLTSPYMSLTVSIEFWGE